MWWTRLWGGWKTQRVSVSEVSSIQVDGHAFLVYTDFDNFLKAITTVNRGALQIRSRQYQEITLALHKRLSAAFGNSSQRVMDIYCAALYCGGCKVEFPSSFKSALQGGFGANPLVFGATPGFREFGNTGLCPQCASGDSLFVYEHFPAETITEDDVKAIQDYRRLTAQQWWETSGRTTGICDDCNADLSFGQGFLAGSHLICDNCMRQSPVTLENLKRKPEYYGANLIRKARGFRKPPEAL